MITLNEFVKIIDEMAPLATAESFDNVGLLVGNPEQIVEGVLIAHDAIPEVIEEAVAKNLNVVLSFHPIWFAPIKKLTGQTYVERSIMLALKNDIAIVAIHTALDNHASGVNKIMCDKLGLIDTKILMPKTHHIYKLVTYIPIENLETLRNALFEAGAGQIGNYEDCSFSSLGKGTYMGNENSNPEIGERFEFVEATEAKLEVVFEKHLKNDVLKALFKNHVYEEVAYEIYALENEYQNTGLGRIGSFENELSEDAFLAHVKNIFKVSMVRHSQKTGKKIKKVAVLGGSGAKYIKEAQKKGANAYVTADVTYHQFFEAKNNLLLVDVGHYESERYTKNYMLDYLEKKITTFAITLSEVNTNPVNYF